MPELSKHPVILSKHSRISTVILSDVYERCGHFGRNCMLSILRQIFWIPQANSAIRKLIRKCSVCRKLNGRVGEQKITCLPEGRLLPNKPPKWPWAFDAQPYTVVENSTQPTTRSNILLICSGVDEQQNCMLCKAKDQNKYTGETHEWNVCLKGLLYFAYDV